MTRACSDPLVAPGVRSLGNGQCVLSGAALGLYQRLDELFLEVADEWGGQEILFPLLIPARELARLDYFRSFPQLATFACSLHDAPDNLEAFASGPGIDASGAVTLTELAPVCQALTPAACYPIYVHLAGQTLAREQRITTRNTCFRRETHFEPLRRQAQFTMREVVCVGCAEEVKGFLATATGRVTDLAKELGLELAWEAATDPFFNAAAHPKFLAQKIEPVKHEMVFRDDLALGSVNFHRNFFGDVFGIECAGASAFSGCVAFGLERWVYAVLARHGADPERWPALLRQEGR